MEDDFANDMDLLIGNFIAYLLFFLYLLKANKYRLNLQSFVALNFVIVAFLGYYTFKTGIYQKTFGYKDVTTLSIVPYVLCLAMVVMLIIPLRQIETVRKMDTHTGLGISEKWQNYISFAFLGLVIVYFYMNQLLVSQRSEFVEYDEIYENMASGNLEKFDSPILNTIYFRLITLIRLLSPFIYYFQFSILANKKKKESKVLPLVLIFGSFILSVFPDIESASRGAMYFSAMQLCFFMFIYFRSFTPGVKLFTVVAISGSILLLVIFSMAISYSRFGEGKEGNEQIFRYFGEPYPNLGFNVWNKNIRHPYGKRYFPRLTTGSGKSFAGREDRFTYWERKVGIPMLNLKTIFGDLYVEFGALGAFVVVALWLLLLHFCLYKARGDSLATVILLYYAYNIVVYGLFNNHLSEDTLKEFFYSIIIILVIRFVAKKMKEKNDLTRHLYERQRKGRYGYYYSDNDYKDKQ